MAQHNSFSSVAHRRQKVGHPWIEEKGRRHGKNDLTSGWASSLSVKWMEYFMSGGIIGRIEGRSISEKPPS